MIKQIGLLLRGRPILLITRMITDQIGLHSVLLPLLITPRVYSPQRSGIILYIMNSSNLLTLTKCNPHPTPPPVPHLCPPKHTPILIHNGNKTEWSPARSVIIQVINKIGRPCSRSLICLITSMITDRIGQHKVLSNNIINHICNKIQERKRRKRTGEGIDNSF